MSPTQRRKKLYKVFSVYFLLLFIYPFVFIFASLHETRDYIRFYENDVKSRNKKDGSRKSYLWTMDTWLAFAFTSQKRAHTTFSPGKG